MSAVLVRVTIELLPEEAAALTRLCDKLAYDDAKQYLYPHISREIRSEQCYQMVHAAGIVHQALRDAGVSAWPWIDTGIV